MADIPDTLRSWSATAGSNSPTGGTSIGTGLDDNLRAIQAAIRGYLAGAPANMASGSTVDLSTATSNYVNITGTTTITAFGTESSGIQVLLKFAGALTLTHNATSLILPGAANITTAAGDMALMVSEGSGNWRCVHYVNANGVGFLQAGTGAVKTYVQTKLREFVSVKDFGATGDGSTDDTAAIQAAADRAILIRGELIFPPATAGQHYKITSPITFNGPCVVRGMSSHGVLIYGVGMSAGEHLFDFDCLAASTVELVTISGLTLRSDDGVPNGLRLKNASYALVKNVRLYNVEDGIVVEGTRCFTHSFEQVDGVQIGTSNVKWASGFSGGGQFNFDGCTFTGNVGVSLPSTASIDNLAFSGCNFEQCTGNSMLLNGTCSGVSIVGCRTEGCDGIDFIFRPVLAAEFIGGINISGNVFSASDAGASARISIGGDAGTVRGFSVTGNIVTHGTDAFTGSLVRLNGDGESGLVSGNYLRGTTATAVDTQRAGVVVFGNENTAGKLSEYWGAATWKVTQSTFTATATGMTTSPTGTVSYSVVGNTVTLDLPSISGTSNSTSFTLTGGPVAIRPTTDKDVILRVVDNGSGLLGFARVKTTGVIELYASVSGAAFTNSGTKSIHTNSITYTLA